MFKKEKQGILEKQKFRYPVFGNMRNRDIMRTEPFKMERQGLVEVGQEVVLSERSPSTGRYTYLVEPSIAMSGIYKTNARIKARKGIIREIQDTPKGFYLIVEVEE